MQHRLV